MKRLAIIAVVASVGAARAESPSRVFVGIGGGFPGAGNFGAEYVLDTAVVIDRDRPWRAHAMFARGQADGEDYPSNMLYWNARAGGELASCSRSGTFCWLVDGDLGVMHFRGADWVHGMATGPLDRYGLLVGGRAGFDTGTADYDANVRFRLTLDVAKAVTGPFVVHDTMGSARDMSLEVALQLELVVGFD